MAEKEKVREKKVAKQIPADETPTLSWVSPDFVARPRDNQWHLIVIGVGVVVAIVMALQQVWMGVAFIVAAVLYMIFVTEQKPKDVECDLYEEGVVVSGKVYTYTEFKYFWVSPGDLPKIHLQYSGFMGGQIILPLLNIDPETVRLFLSERMLEEEMQGEDITDSINRWLKL
jgi:hypothetical protein